MTSKEIIDHIAGVLKKVDPTVKKVHLEQISNLKTPAFSIEVISDNTSTFSKAMEDRSLALNIIYYPEGKNLSKSLEMSGKLMELFLPTFQVGDSYFDFPEGVESKFINENLNFLATFDWQQYSKRTFVGADDEVFIYDASDEMKEDLMNKVYDLEKMGSIDLTINRE